MNDIMLYRRRFIPDELIYLKDDEVISADSEKVITKWKVLKPRQDFSRGISCYFINEGFKVSKFLNDKNELVYWYCDIIDTEIGDNSYIFNDLLIDVIVCKDGLVKVVDLDEVGIALEKDILSKEYIVKAMYSVNKLLKIIYSGRFEEYTRFIDEV